ncbi:MAG: hypothetical protein R6U68_03750 [Desulfobacteraceae bacterium]
MKNFAKISFVCTIGLIFFISSSCCAGQTESTGENVSAREIHSAAKKESAPCVFFPAHTYKFKNAVEGTEIVHSFMVQNKGNAPLLIQNVRTG